jgi:hypothetical protein
VAALLGTVNVIVFCGYGEVSVCHVILNEKADMGNSGSVDHPRGRHGRIPRVAGKNLNGFRRALPHLLAFLGSRKFTGW